MTSSKRKGKNDSHDQVAEELRLIREELEEVKHEIFYRELKKSRSRTKTWAKKKPRLKAAQDRWIKQTSDGWLKIRVKDGSILSVPSFLRVSFQGTSSGRDDIVIAESLNAGIKADVATGFLETSTERYSNLIAVFENRAGGPIVVDGVTYDKQLSLSFKDAGGMANTAGPYPAKTDPDHPTPTGTHVIEIPDYPHSLGAGYGAWGTVWFRIGASGDRYIHPGRVSLGCVTCAPKHWPEICAVLIKARRDNTTVGQIRVV